ncbi:MAG: PKD domain-containing protein [Anaerolineae bacterium]
MHTYAAGGTYTVTLAVTGSDGRTDDQSQTVQVASPLTAEFASQVSNLDVQFTDQSSGQIVAYQWDFGDGSSNDQNPQHSYAADGAYTVTLTITGGDGSSTSASHEVTVSAPAVEPTQPPQQTIVDTTPILPNFNNLHDALRGIYASGVNSFGNQATVFSTAGDSIFTLSGILDPFATGQYDLSGKDDLEAIIEWYNSTDLGGVTSFNSNSLAVNSNWMAQSLLDPNQADPSCGGESPLACELHRTHPVLMFVVVGANDAQFGTDAGTFQSLMNQIVATVTSNGTIPVLVTIPDNGGNPNVEPLNEVIINVAQANGVPLLNAARALNELPGFNLDASPSGAGALDIGSVSSFGINALNFNLLQVLSDARNIIFPDA